jgi:glycosyltransferase involved in cell wall biosynthesis
MGVDFSVITSTRGSRRASHDEKYRVIELPSTGLLALDMLLHVTFLLPCLFALALVVGVDAIQADSLVSLFPSSLFGKILQKPTTLHVWGDEQLGLLSRNARVINLLADCIIVLNQNAMDRLVASGIPSSKIRLIPNGVDIPPAGISPSKREVDVVWIGRLVPSKRPQLALAGFARANAVRSHLRLMIVGDGPLRARLENIVASLRLQENVTFLGRKEHGEIAGILSNARILLITSYTEGLSNVLLEGMASGCGVASTIEASGGIIQNLRNGILFEGTEDGTSDAILALLDDDDLVDSLGLHARDDIKANFSFGHIVEIYVQFYLELIKDANH